MPRNKKQGSEPIKRYSLQDESHPDRYFNMDRMEDIFDRTQGKTNDPHRHDFYTIVWVKQGSGQHLIDFETYEIRDNQVFFLSPGKIHQVHTPTRPTGCVISFSKDFLLINDISEDFMINVHLFRQYGEAPPLEPDMAMSQKLGRIVDDMYEIFCGELVHKEAALGALMKLFLIHSNTVCDLPQEDNTNLNGSHLVRDFKKLVEANYKKKHKVSEYADSLFITPKYLNEVFKNLAGYAPKDYILERISTEAKRQLLFSKRTIKEVAFDLGFKEQFHFSAFFKKHIGVSPKEFRRGVVINN